MAKKIFIISLIIFFVALATLVFYKIFLSEGNRSKNVIFNSRNTERENGIEGKESAEIDAKVSRITDKSVKGARIWSGKSEIAYYENQNFISLNFESSTRKTIGAYPFSSATSILWSQKQNKAIVNDAGNFFVYDFEGNSAVRLRDVDVVIWNATGEKLVYKYFDPETKQRRLAISNDEGAEEEVLVQDIPFAKVDLLAIPKSNAVCYFPLPEANTESALNCVDSKTGKKKAVISELYGADYLCSLDGKRILVSYLNRKGGDKLNLGVMSSSGGEFLGLNFHTSAKKCSWSKDGKNVYCSTITDIPEHAVLPNDWEEKKHYSTDTFWKIDTETGQKQRIVELEEIPGKLDAEKFFADEKEKNLFFTERQSGNLYRIKF